MLKPVNRRWNDRLIEVADATGKEVCGIVTRVQKIIKEIEECPQQDLQRNDWAYPK